MKSDTDKLLRHYEASHLENERVAWWNPEIWPFTGYPKPFRFTDVYITSVVWPPVGPQTAVNHFQLILFQSIGYLHRGTYCYPIYDVSAEQLKQSAAKKPNFCVANNYIIFKINLHCQDISLYPQKRCLVHKPVLC